MTAGRARTTATMTVLLLLLVVGAVVGWRALSAPVPDDDPAGQRPRCTAEIARGDVVRSRDVRVSVYNAGSRPGLAGRTLEQLTERGFLPGQARNAPATLPNVRDVRVFAPTRRDPAARLVARQFGKGTRVRVAPEDLGPGVAVAVGNDFVGLADAPRRLRARAAGTGC